MNSTVKPISELSDATVGRFWSKVDKTDTCWLWNGYKHEGYGRFHWGGFPQMAHRIAWLLTYGSLPEKPLVLDHRCRTRHCVNPSHLEAVTDKVNLLRGDGPTARNAAKTHCPKGHEYTTANTYKDPKGKRHCLVCKSARRKQTHCSKGHDLTPDSSFQRGTQRVCRICFGRSMKNRDRSAIRGLKGQ